MINWLKYKKIFFIFTGIMVTLSALSLLGEGLLLGIDFSGGSITEYRFTPNPNTEDISKVIENSGIQVQSLQKTGGNTYLLKSNSLSQEDKAKLNQNLKDQLNTQPEELKFENVGPSIGPELIKKTVFAILISSLAILLWVAIQFKSLKYGISAILAMIHDTFILIGSFSILGYLFKVEVDYLFVTALLTTLSFSVHDTIVVFDRIREIAKTRGGKIEDISNLALTETMVRSLNNSFTIIFMLIALILLGGSSIRWFSVALFIGTVLGTYSSPFVAVPILVSWDNLLGKIKSK